MAEPTAMQRRMLAKSGVAMPDGSYYIRNETELGDAIQAVGRATPNAGESDVARRNAVRRHIIMRAKMLNLSSKIPDTWAPDGSLKEPAVTHVAAGEAFILEHFGRKGMHWGEHVFGRGKDTTSHISDDAARSIAIRAKIQKHGIASLSNAELQHHVTRLNLEQQHARLTAHPSNVAKGHAIVKTILGGAKTGLDAYNTGAQAYKTGKEIHKTLRK